MTAVLFKTFVPEIFLSMSILGHILFNVNLIVNEKTNFSIINKEIFGQIIFILSSVTFLYSNIKIDSIRI